MDAVRNHRCSAASPFRATPGRIEPSASGRRRFDLFSKRGQRHASESAEHFDVDPLAAPSPWPELALEHTAIDLESLQRRAHDSCTDPEASRDVLGDKRAPPGGEATGEITGRIRDGFEERRGDPYWQRGTESVAIVRPRPRSR